MEQNGTRLMPASTLLSKWDSSKRGKPSLELLFSGTVKVMQEEKGCGRPQQRQEKREGRKEPDE